MNKTLLTLLVTLCLGASARAQQTAPVRVEQGLVQGEKMAGLTVYCGIPFAAPPVGDLRWRAPQPAAKWDGVKETTRFAPKPMQGSRNASDSSEDCLYLNLWTLAKSADERVPVLVWIYGGGFAGGSTSDPVHNGEHLARKGVVLVSIAYRVGVLGFLAHPELSAENTNRVSGNYGLLDMIAGLQWIRQNIGAFGGDLSPWVSDPIVLTTPDALPGRRQPVQRFRMVAGISRFCCSAAASVHCRRQVGDRIAGIRIYK